MPPLSHLPENDRAEVLRLATGVRRELADMGGRLRLTLEGTAPVDAAVPTAHMAPVPGIEGLFWLQLPCAQPKPPTCTRLVVGGLAGAHHERVQVPHVVRLQLLEGALLWWQESLGYDSAGQKLYRRQVAGDVLRLAPDEAHSFVVLMDFLTYNTFTPAFPAN